LYMKRDSDGTELVTFTGAVGATVGASIDVWKNITVMFSVEYRAVFSTPVVHMLSILFSAGVRV
jgi:hypothetical protein